LKSILPRLLGLGGSDSWYYRQHRQGCDGLRNKGVLSEDGKPTDSAFRILPPEVLTDMARIMRDEVVALARAITGHGCILIVWGGSG